MGAYVADDDDLTGVSAPDEWPRNLIRWSFFDAAALVLTNHTFGERGGLPIVT